MVSLVLRRPEHQRAMCHRHSDHSFRWHFSISEFPPRRHTFISVLQGHKQNMRSLKLKCRNLIRLFQVSGLYFNLVSLVLISDALHYMFPVFSHTLSLCSFRSQATISNIRNCFLKLHVVSAVETWPKLGFGMDLPVLSPKKIYIKNKNRFHFQLCSGGTKLLF